MLVSGDVITGRELVAVSGVQVRIPDPDLLVHLQFRRFAGCPICNLHLRSFVARHEEIVAAGIREVVVFHSPAVELRDHVAGLTFDVIADPDKRLYVAFGVESAPRALLDPRAWPKIVRAVIDATPRILRGNQLAPAARPEGGRLGLPADFLIEPGGRLLAHKYGRHAADQWSADELLSLALQR